MADTPSFSWRNWASELWDDIRSSVDATMDEDMSTSAADKTVSFTTDWVTDGHQICWNGQHGAFMGHTDRCPYYIENRMRVYCCSPGFYANEYGISLDDLPEEDAEACREWPMGTETIRWRLTEYIHPDLTVEEQNRLAVFEFSLDNNE